MAKRTQTKKPERRSRSEIDRNYFIGDILIKEGAAVAVVLGLVALFTPFTLGDAIRDGMTNYVVVMGLFGFVGVVSFLYGRHLRKEATHWDVD